MALASAPASSWQSLRRSGLAAHCGEPTREPLVCLALTEATVLFGISLLCLSEDLLDELTTPIRVRRDVCCDLGAVDRDETGVNNAGVHAADEHLIGQTGDRLLMATTKAGDRRVVGGLIRGEDAKSDGLVESALDATARAFADAEGVEHDRKHEALVIVGTTAAVIAVR